MNRPGSLRFRKWPGVCVLADYTDNSPKAMFSGHGCLLELHLPEEEEAALSHRASGKDAEQLLEQRSRGAYGLATLMKDGQGARRMCKSYNPR